MRAQTEHVLQKLFSQTSLDNISVEQLRRIVDEHPYFTLGQLLLAKKLQTENGEEYQGQSEKAALYFNEPIWLQSLLYPPSERELQISEMQISERSIESEPGSATDEEPIPVVEEPVIHEVSSREQTSEINMANEPIQSLEESSEVGEEPSIVQGPHEVDTPQAESTHRLSRIAVEDIKEAEKQIFEPYHTIDYFASQGIRVSHEIKSNDRLAQQLRSFTEWLKTMKRLPESQVEEQLDEVTQQNIQDFAAHSLDEKEVLTESMAEVLVKQNRQGEAVTIYEKLSLLNPSKRAYFAAKIEQLKGL